MIYNHKNKNKNRNKNKRFRIYETSAIHSLKKCSKKYLSIRKYNRLKKIFAINKILFFLSNENLLFGSLRNNKYTSLSNRTKLRFRCKSNDMYIYQSKKSLLYFIMSQRFFIKKKIFKNYFGPYFLFAGPSMQLFNNHWWDFLDTKLFFFIVKLNFTIITPRKLLELFIYVSKANFIKLLIYHHYQILRIIKIKWVLFNKLVN